MAAFVEDIVLVFNINGGEDKTLSFRKLPFTAWRELKANLGFTPKTMLHGAIIDEDVEAQAAIVWLERKQNLKDLRWTTVARELEFGEWDLTITKWTKAGETMYDAEADDVPAFVEVDALEDPTKP